MENFQLSKRLTIGGERVEEFFEGSQKTNNPVSLKYKNKDFYSLEDLSLFLSNEANGRDELKKLFLRGHISTWYSRQGLIDEAMEIDDLRESGKKEAFDLFLKKYCPQFDPNPFADFISKINLERIKYEFTKVKKSGKLPLFAIGLAVAIGTGAWIPISVLFLIFYLRKSNKSSNSLGAKIKKEINFDELKNIGREIRDEFKKEFNSEKKDKNRDKEWEAEKKRELEKVRKAEIAKMRRKRRRGKTLRTFFVVGGISYLAVNNPTLFPSFITNIAYKIQGIFFNVVQPIFYQIYDIIKEIISNF